MLVTRAGQHWLSQFRQSDRNDAELLLSTFKFIDADTFRYDLAFLLSSKLPSDEVSALYVEREEPSSTKRMYKEATLSRGSGKTRRRRAHGLALPVVRSPRRINQIVGSEGVVANIASGLARAEPSRFLLQPSAELLRERNARHLVVVSDFIGSGYRVDRFLSLLWDVRSIRSWRSYHKITLWVFAYSATANGRQLIAGHRANPTIEIVSSCPTLTDAFHGDKRLTIEALCREYSPTKKDPLGYRNVAALIAFAHGCPNDAPAIFHKDSRLTVRPWHALFSRRVTQSDHVGAADVGQLELALDTIGFSAIKSAPAFLRSNRQQKQVIVLLCALSRGRRYVDSLSFATGLKLTELVDLETCAIAQGLLRSDRRLTEPGFALLKKLQKPRPQALTVPASGNWRYYPVKLRAPR